MLNFVLCDDNKHLLNKFSQLLQLVFDNNELNGNISYISTNGKDILDFIKHNTVDVAILDIDLKDTYSGLQLANDIRSINKSIYIIFLTGHLEYLLFAYKCKTFDYLTKPITFNNLETTILRLFNDIYSNYSTHSFIKINNNKTLINQNSINYIEKDRTKIVIKTDSADYIFYSSFNKLLHDLPKNFVRCHKSYIVNINNIESIDKLTIKLKNNHICYIGKNYKNKLLEELKIEQNNRIIT